jgi:hypothetical protein
MYARKEWEAERRNVTNYKSSDISGCVEIIKFSPSTLIVISNTDGV